MLTLIKPYSELKHGGLRYRRFKWGIPVKTENPPPDNGRTETAKRILVIEDQELNRKVVRIVLQSKGYTVVEATDAMEALACLEDAMPHLILMDIALPGQSGEDLTRRIKANLAWVEIPIIALTAAAMSGDKERILKAGCDDYLSKPIDIKILIERVETHLRRAET